MLHMRNVSEWVEESGLPATEVARRSGVSRSTIMRIQNGTVSPSVSTLTELAIACGKQLHLTTRPLSDPHAAQAARLMLEDGFVPDDQGQTEAWVNRLKRLCLDGPVDIVQTAARASAPRQRQGAHFFAGRRAMLAAASAGDASGGDWAISGEPILDLENGTVVLHCQDSRRCAGLLRESMRETNSAATADLIVLEAGPATFYDAWEQDGVRMAAPIQGLLDCIGLGGQLGQAALDEARRW